MNKKKKRYQDGIYNTAKVEFLQQRFPKLREIPWEKRLELVKILNDIYFDGGGTECR